jgi:hypothetical protein
MWGMRVNGASQADCIQLSHRRHHQEAVVLTDVWINHIKELKGGGELETMSRVIKPCFWYKKVKSIFKIVAEEKLSYKNSLQPLVSVVFYRAVGQKI